VNRGHVRLPVTTDHLRKLLQRIALLFLNPVAIVGAVWVVNIGDVSIAALPLVGFFALTAGGILALGAARVLRLEARKTGAMFCCGSFTNIGSIGALVCFLFLGETGFALVPIYKLFEEVSYYAIGFPIARYYSGATEPSAAFGARLRALLKDPFIVVAVSSLLIGGIPNWSGPPRPAVYKSVVSLFVPLATVMLLASIGLALRFRRVRDYLKEAVAVALIKFVIVPVCAAGLAYLIGFGRIDGGMPLKVVLILSSMPVAFNALIPPSIYDLDLDLANSCWFVTTGLLALVLPALIFVLGFL
jgi:predicted permease